MRLIILTALLAATLPACGEPCGPGDAPASGVTGSAEGETVAYGQFTTSPNNDCSVAGHPTSLTLDGIQTDPAASPPLHLTFCLPRPDQIDGEVALDDLERIEVIDLFAEMGDCFLALDRTVAPTGTITFDGYCADGTDPAGYAIRFDGTVGGTLSCPDGDGGADRSVTVTLGGEAAVTAL
jgi:hypothetical protein